jgi:inorganic pyrophosphatase
MVRELLCAGLELQPILPVTVINLRPVGVLEMDDEGGTTNKLPVQTPINYELVINLTTR